jgi:hypothetical protein
VFIGSKDRLHFLICVYRNGGYLDNPGSSMSDPATVQRPDTVADLAVSVSQRWPLLLVEVVGRSSLACWVLATSSASCMTVVYGCFCNI